MEEKNHTSKLKIIGMIVLIFIALGAIGWGFLGNHTTEKVIQTQNSKSSTSTSQSSKQKLNTSNKLSEKVVNKFLNAYYTAKSSNSNSRDYEPLMTEDAYGVIQASIKSEGGMGQNGYIMNQKLDQSSLYINSTTQTVFCNIDYHYDIYKDENDLKSKVVSDFKSHATIELQYTHKSGEWLVQAMTPITITNNVTGEKINE
ncbi:hypothetical protein [Lactococcus lactis]|uniref:hypothetical protein n=1 Tax=Lactococcus lactis TaxID=1358 RepID=UPI00024D906D|nr:hypothetical protein [Lactococcus lactis]BAL51150.1 hypothetical protein lilo_1151 [Lactococcus lactis subsp. lactis IO-1]